MACVGVYRHCLPLPLPLNYILIYLRVQSVWENLVFYLIGDLVTFLERKSTLA